MSRGEEVEREETTMKKILMLILGIMLIATVVEAGCGSCPSDAKKAAKAKANASVCDIKGTCKADAAKAKVECEVKAAKTCGANCKKPCCSAKEIKDNASEKAQEKRKKWWKFWGDKEEAAE